MPSFHPQPFTFIVCFVAFTVVYFLFIPKPTFNRNRVALCTVLLANMQRNKIAAFVIKANSIVFFVSSALPHCSLLTAHYQAAESGVFGIRNFIVSVHFNGFQYQHCALPRLHSRGVSSGFNLKQTNNSKLARFTGSTCDGVQTISVKGISIPNPSHFSGNSSYSSSAHTGRMQWKIENRYNSRFICQSQSLSPRQWFMIACETRWRVQKSLLMNTPRKSLNHSNFLVFSNSLALACGQSRSQFEYS